LATSDVVVIVCFVEWGQAACSPRQVATIPKNIVAEPGVPYLPAMAIASHEDILRSGIKQTGVLVLKNAIPKDIAQKAEEAVEARARHAISCKGGKASNCSSDFDSLLKIRS